MLAVEAAFVTGFIPSTSASYSRTNHNKLDLFRSFQINSDLRDFSISFFFKVIDFERFNLQSIQVA